MMLVWSWENDPLENMPLILVALMGGPAPNHEIINCFRKITGFFGVIYLYEHKPRLYGTLDKLFGGDCT